MANEIPETVEFNGRVYRWNGKYYRKSRTFLHRDVWVFHNGPIPKGYHIHHVDENAANNTIENLQMVWGSTHLSEHQLGMNKPTPVWAFAAQKAWRESDEGKAFLSAMGKRNSVYLGQEKEFKCECCGEYFFSPNVGSNRFCSNKCRAKWRRDSGVDDVTKVCLECGSEFQSNKYRGSDSCSASCGRKLWQKTEAGQAHLKRLAEISRSRPKKS